MELTQEYFDQQLKGLNQRMDGFATKDDLKTLATKDDLLEFPTKQQVSALDAKIDGIQDTVNRLDQRADEDTRAALKDIVSLKKRVAGLEKELNLRPTN